jgi:sulfite reductase beta subunit-like hemoprotein
MNKLMQTVLLVLVGLAVLAAASPALIKLVAAFVPLALVLGVVVAVLRIVWAATRRW